MKMQTRCELPPPCRVCYQVSDPVACENKNCKVWREWFIAKWDQRRQQLRQVMEQEPVPVQGVPLGGRQYYHPEQLRRYFEKDPCKICWLAECLCEEPCPFKKDWEDAKEEAEL